MSSLPRFMQKQFEFASHIRDPDRHDCPGDVEDRRMAIYRELFYNNVEGFLATSFPVLKSLLDENAWNRLARDFFTRHRCQSPIFLDIPAEFLEYLQDERQPETGDLPFMYELAHYEWTELALGIAEDELDYNNIEPNGDMLSGVPVMSPVAWALAYSFPVHRISTDFQPEQADDQPTFLVVYRDRNDTIGFIEINAVTARLLDLVEENQGKPADQVLCGSELLDLIAKELSDLDPVIVRESGLKILHDMQAAGVLLGTLK